MTGKNEKSKPKPMQPKKPEPANPKLVYTVEKRGPAKKKR